VLSSGSSSRETASMEARSERERPPLMADSRRYCSLREAIDHMRHLELANARHGGIGAKRKA